VTELVEYLHPLANGEVFILLVVLKRIPFLLQILTPPLNVKLEEEWPVILTAE
jgi:hypothetical protein